jgi:hypothetical protein
VIAGASVVKGGAIASLKSYLALCLLASGASKRQNIYGEILLISTMISPCCNLSSASGRVFKRS